MERGLGLRRRDALPCVDQTADDGGIGDDDRCDDVPEGASEKSFVLVAKGVGIVGPRWPMEVEEDAPGRELVSLAPKLGFVEERALEVELAEGYGRNNEVGGIQCVEDKVVECRGRIDEEKIVG